MPPDSQPDSVKECRLGFGQPGIGTRLSGITTIAAQESTVGRPEDGYDRLPYKAGTAGFEKVRLIVRVAISPEPPPAKA